MKKLVFAAGVLVLAGCASLEPIDDGARQAMLLDFEQGNATLDCRTACAGLDGFHSSDMRGLYDAGLWNDLALLVMSVDFDEDQTWFYLARAAEELGFEGPAEKYLRKAKAAHVARKSCDFIFSACNGLDIATLIDERLTYFNGRAAERRRAETEIREQTASELQAERERASVEIALERSIEDAKERERLAVIEQDQIARARRAEEEAQASKRAYEAEVEAREAQERDRLARIDREQAEVESRAREEVQAEPVQRQTSRPPERRRAVTSSQPWYSGGTLHSSDMSSWVAATPRNRLATASDFTIAALGKSRFGNVDQVRPYASQLVQCIDGSFVEGAGFVKTSEIGAACAVLMGWRK